jgi:hypothetical protein
MPGLYWAHRRFAATGLSACIFFAGQTAGKKGYRFYPLRVSSAVCGLPARRFIPFFLFFCE